MSTDVLLADAVIERDLLEVEARALVDSIRVDITDVGERIATAYLGRAWIALGYTDWDALCDGEFEGARLRVPREVRVELVQSLSAAGLSTRSAAKALGVSDKTVRNDLSAGAEKYAPETRGPVVGQDGKRYAPTQPPRPQTSPSPEPAVVVAARPTSTGGGEQTPEGGDGAAPGTQSTPVAPAGQAQELTPPSPTNDELDDELNEKLDSTDLRYLINLSKAIVGCQPLLDLAPHRAIETYDEGSDPAVVLDSFLDRMDAWTRAVRDGLRPPVTLRSVR